MLLVSLGATVSRDLSPADVSALPATTPLLNEAYGPSPLQVGELRLPPGPGPFPVAIVIHGGCFIAKFGSMRATAPIASALAAKGIATWNIEYRALGVPGSGWPGTMLDWGNGSDHLRSLAKRFPLDLTRVIVVGHSAGGTGALFVAAREQLPVSSEVRGDDPIHIRAVVDIDGPLDLAATRSSDLAECGEPVTDELLGGTPTNQPAHYANVSAILLAPMHMPQFIVAAQVLKPRILDAYLSAARRDHVTILTPRGGTHFNIVAPGEPQWTEVEAMILQAIPKK
jgi:acetyl esterase/lipase